MRARTHMLTTRKYEMKPARTCVEKAVRTTRVQLGNRLVPSQRLVELLRESTMKFTQLHTEKASESVRKTERGAWYVP